MRIIKGIPTSQGIVVGKAYVIASLGRDDGFHTPSQRIPVDSLDEEVQRFTVAVQRTREEFTAARQALEKKAGVQHARILDAHLLLLEDKDFLNKVENEIRANQINAEAALAHVANEYLEAFQNVPDEYLRERAADIKDVIRRILNTLLGSARKTLEKLEEDVVVIAHDLPPSQTATMHQERVVGIVTEIGGPTSHTSIMARALEVPAVSGAEGILETVSHNQPLIVDGYEGIVIIDPQPAQYAEYEEKREKVYEQKAALLQRRNEPAVTKDDHTISLVANIELPEEVSHACDMGAEGVGLYRTEFLYMNRTELPSEETQFEAYSRVIDACGGKPVTIRTLDLGGDKFASALTLAPEMNPSMGWRAIRMCLERRDIFMTQLRAILRASALGTVRIMFPLITHIGEIRKAKAILHEAAAQLRDEKIAFDEHIEIGAMIEVPSAALCTDVLAQEVDFFSIGTNDLIQYTLAIDRINEKTAEMYDPMNQAVLRLLHLIIDAAHCRTCMKKDDTEPPHPACMIGRIRENRPIRVSVCGEVAAHPMMAYLLIGMGVDELSMAATSIPETKEFIRSIEFKQAKAIVRDALMCATSSEVRALLKDHGIEKK